MCHAIADIILLFINLGMTSVKQILFPPFWMKKLEPHGIRRFYQGLRTRVFQGQDLNPCLDDSEAYLLMPSE